MHLDDRNVERHGFELDADDLLALHPLKHPLQNPAFAPATHARVDGMPAPKPLRQATPLAALLRHMENRVEHIQVAHFHIAALSRQALFNSLLLRFGDLHPHVLAKAHTESQVV